MKNQEYTFHYPHNLNEDAVLIMWSHRNFIITAIAALFSLLFLLRTGVFIPLVFCAVFALMTARIGDITIYEYLKILAKYIFFDHLILHFDEGGNPTMPNKNTCEREMNISFISNDHLQLFSQNIKQSYIILEPINTAVLPPEIMFTKVQSLANSIKALSESQIQIEIITLNSTKSFETNKQYLTARIEQEKNIKLRNLLQKDLIDLENIKLQAAANREFAFILNFYNETESTRYNLEQRAVSTLKDGGFNPRIAEKDDFKRLLAIYYEQRLDVEDLVEYDGEQYLRGSKDEI